MHYLHFVNNVMATSTFTFVTIVGKTQNKAKVSINIVPVLQRCKRDEGRKALQMTEWWIVKAN